ncbi:TPA: hypothetical protein HA239_06060 [Candidatus Woesearchaeota archaeon]|nr:Ribonuclease P protein component 2 [archaeon GW2011_AR15]MBS3104229.1 hypothetical protein [Candidatus Woesearchaeota archaeon]HIH41940.1 hypothetical protein [Candidatus Woesearchaeota archaeon]
MKGKPLLPTLRIKKRYVVYEVVSEQAIDSREAVKAIIESYAKCFGTFGLAEAGILDTRIYAGSRGMLKINHRYVDNLRAAMAMIKTINTQKVIIRTAAVSGILRKAKLKL